MRKETRSLLKQLVANQELIMKHFKIKPALAPKAAAKKKTQPAGTGKKQPAGNKSAAKG
jgi:hypothetical protein